MPWRRPKTRAKRTRYVQRGSALYRSGKWQTIRRQVLEEEPFCNGCGVEMASLPGKAQHVDHIIPHGGDPELFFDRGNCQAACNRCHGGKTRRDQRGG